MWQKIPAYLSVISISVAYPFLAIAQQTAKPDTPQPSQWPHGPGHWHMWGNPGWHFWWTPLTILLFFVLFFAAIRYFWPDKRWDMGRPGYDSRSSAIEILNERFARGEIPEDEYEAKKAKILSA